MKQSTAKNNKSNLPKKTHNSHPKGKAPAPHRAKKNKPAQQQPTRTFSATEKIVHSDTVRMVKERIKRLNEKITLPFEVKTMQKGEVTKVKVLNIDGIERQLLPDTPAKHKILCHGRMAKVITSGMCVFSKITAHEEIEPVTQKRRWIDGSWTIAPCHPAMLRGTTVQHVRRRKWFFLRRYWYEITFDGRVQPGGMFYDYDIDPLTKTQTFYVTHEAVKVKGTDKENTFFRFWKHKP